MRKTCEQCSGTFDGKRPQQRYCSPACGYAAKRKPPKVAATLGPRRCEICGIEYAPRADNQLYCSTTCRERAKYRATRTDPDRWAAYLRKARSKYEPRPRVKVDRRCEMDGCNERHFAKGLCRSHYYQARWAAGKDGATVATVTLSAMCHRWAATKPKVKRVRCRHTVGIMPECPMCSTLMRSLSGIHFICQSCWVEAEFNAEEVAWLANSDMLSTPR